MQIPVMIESMTEGGFCAKAGDPFGICAHGATRDEALRKVRDLIEKKINSGSTEIVQLDIPIPDNPWLRAMGTLDPNDPMVQEWVQIMEENRRKADEDPDYP